MSNVQCLLHEPLSNTYRITLYIRRVQNRFNPLVNHIFEADPSVPPADNRCSIPGQTMSQALVRQSLDVNVEQHITNENPRGWKSILPD